MLCGSQCFRKYNFLKEILNILEFSKFTSLLCSDPLGCNVLTLWLNRIDQRRKGEKNVVRICVRFEQRSWDSEKFESFLPLNEICVALFDLHKILKLSVNALYLYSFVILS